ncbi:MAG: helix-turn-helix transcriptional regulator [Epsilonproteobacteria bacterium]|nr:helix-turn-helix transcriptional regulator [Campylobacterota bacterium]
MPEDENIVKATCKELGITQKELAERLGTHLTTVQKWASANEIPTNAKKTIDLIFENRKLKEKVDMFTKALNMLDEARGK